MSVILNPLRAGAAAPPPPPDARRLLHQRLPGYAPTELRALPRLAERWGVGRVLAKAETERFGLPSFKVLGASWAVHRALLERAGLPLDTAYDPAARSELVQAAGLRALVTATDGNHGRAVAWVARLLGLQAEVLVPRGTAPARIAAIEAEGARVVVSAGDYDSACREAARRAGAGAGCLLVQDTWLPGQAAVPQWIVEGYATLFAEVDDLLPRQEVDAVFIPVGVGSLALAAVRHYWSAPSTLVAVEPADAGCLQRSLLAGGLETVAGPYATSMAGLNCGTPNELAWPELSARLDASVLVDEAGAVEAMRQLAADGIDAGATGAASLAGAEAALLDGAAVARVGLGPTSTVLLLVTEGVTDAAHHAATVGP